MSLPSPIACAARLEVRAIPDVPIVEAEDDLGEVLVSALARADVALRDGDVLAVASKVVSRAEGRFVDLSSIEPSAEARSLAAETDKDPRLVQVVLNESAAVSRKRRGVLVVRHRLGLVSANAAIDSSNARPASAPQPSGPWVLLLPENPDESATRLRKAFEKRWSAQVAVVVTDSLGRPFRLGTVGAAIGLSGLPALWDRRGDRDLAGAALEHTVTALADQIAATADLVAGQAAEGRPLVLVRGLQFPSVEEPASALCRPRSEDLYA